VGAVYLLTIRQLSGRLRLAIMLVLATMPVLVALTVVWSRRGPSVEEFEASVLGAMLAGAITPLVVLAIASAAFANEVEDRTLANLTLSPIPRWQIALPKLLATVSVAAPFIGVSALLTTWLAFTGDLTATVAVAVSSVVGVVLYSAAFLWVSLLTTQVIGVGLLYIVLWEGFFSGFVPGVRVLSIRHYSIAFMHGLDERRFASSELLGFGTVSAISAVVLVGFLWLTIRRLRRMDVP
jgi:ABC-2 type transport system permease protein